MTICKNCKYQKYDIIYGFPFCSHTTVSKKRICYVTGRVLYQNIEECGKINLNGNCKLYKEKFLVKLLKLFKFRRSKNESTSKS